MIWCSVPRTSDLEPSIRLKAGAEQRYAFIEKVGVAGLEAARLHPATGTSNRRLVRALPASGTATWRILDRIAFTGRCMKP